MILLIISLAAAFWLSWWPRWLNAGGAALGRAIAWLALGGLGLYLARIQLRRERQAEAMAALQLGMAHWRTAPASRSRGLAQYVASPQRGGLPGEVWQPGHGWVSRRWDDPPAHYDD